MMPDRNRKEGPSENARSLSARGFRMDILHRLHERQSSHSRKSNLVRLFDSQALDLILFRVYFPSTAFRWYTTSFIAGVFDILPRCALWYKKKIVNFINSNKTFLRCISNKTR